MTLGDQALEQAAAALTAGAVPALTKAAEEGLPDRGEVVAWVERAKGLVLIESAAPHSKVIAEPPTHPVQRRRRSRADHLHLRRDV